MQMPDLEENKPKCLFASPDDAGVHGKARRRDRKRIFASPDDPSVPAFRCGCADDLMRVSLPKAKSEKADMLFRFAGLSLVTGYGWWARQGSNL
jgi:hypothetical protein